MRVSLWVVGILVWAYFYGQAASEPEEPRRPPPEGGCTYIGSKQTFC